MHYSNGRAAKAGDLVRGKGYNIKHEIIGIVIGANPTSSSCNCTVATVTAGSQVLFNACPKSVTRPDGAVHLANFDPPSFYGVLASIEYGQLDRFVAINPKTGEVLPPE